MRVKTCAFFSVVIENSIRIFGFTSVLRHTKLAYIFLAHNFKCIRFGANKNEPYVYCVYLHFYKAETVERGPEGYQALYKVTHLFRRPFAVFGPPASNACSHVELSYFKLSLKDLFGGQCREGRGAISVFLSPCTKFFLTARIAVISKRISK